MWGINVWELLTCGGALTYGSYAHVGGINVWELLTCGGALTCGSYSYVEGVLYVGVIHIWKNMQGLFMCRGSSCVEGHSSV